MRAVRAAFSGSAVAIHRAFVTVKDATGTLYINGAKVVDFRGQPPKDNSIFGLYGASNNDEE